MQGKLGYKIRTITCLGCREIATGHMRPNQRYCTLDCYRRSTRPQRRTGETRPCMVCGKTVYVFKHRIAAAQHVFCSTSHATQWQGRKKVTYICAICGKSFKWSPSRKRVRYCSLNCRDADPTKTEQLLEMNVLQQRGHKTRPERVGYRLLRQLGIAFRPQHVIGGKFCVDAFVPACGLIIQFDGDYWHGHPARFPEPSPRQLRRMALDRSQDAYMAVCGYTVLRIWEHDLKADLEGVTARLLPLVAPEAHTPTLQA